MSSIASARLEPIVDKLPADFEDMQSEARAEGYRFLDRLAVDWESGLMRFDRPGEALLAKFNTIVSCPRVDEALTLKLFERRAPILAERRVLLDAGLQRTAAWVHANDNYVEWVRPNAGAICCVRLKKPVFDDQASGRFYGAATARGARVAKGAWFGEEVRVFRLGFGLLPMVELGDALAVLTDALTETATAGGRS